MSTDWVWSYDGASTAVLEFDSFPANSGALELDCSDINSNTPQFANVPEGVEGHFAILDIGFTQNTQYGAEQALGGPGFTITLSDTVSGLTLAQQNFVWGIPFGPVITVVPYGLELGDRNDITPDGYQDSNTVLRWNNVGYNDGIFGRARQIGLGTNQPWYDSGYDTGSPITAFMNPWLSENW